MMTLVSQGSPRSGGPCRSCQGYDYCLLRTLISRSQRPGDNEITKVGGDVVLINAAQLCWTPHYYLDALVLVISKSRAVLDS